jgi:hypothetical protein
VNERTNAEEEKEKKKEKRKKLRFSAITYPTLHQVRSSL